MPRSCPKNKETQRRFIAPEEQRRGGKTPPAAETVRECLNYAGIAAKEWGDMLSVGERRVQKWRSGEEPVPECRRIEILIKFQDLVTRQLLAINAMVSRALREAYGDADPGRF